MLGVAVETLRRWKRSALACTRECFGVERLEAFQVEQLEAAPSCNRLALVGAKGVGKSALLAWLVWWFLLTRQDANVAITSISGDNLRDGLWKELALWRSRSPVLQATFDWQQTRIANRERPATWWASFRTYSKSADPQAQADTLAGLHADATLFVLDEAGSIPQPVAVTAEAALASGADCKLVLAGNPTNLDGPLYRAAVTDRKHWHVTKVSGDPADPKRSSLVNREWAQQQIDTWGRANPFVKVNVLGEWPEASLNTLLGIEDVNRAMHRHLRADEYEWSQKRLGIDVARFGDDRTVIFPRQGLASFKPVVMRHARNSAVSVEIANRVAAAKVKWGSEVECFDATGGWAAGAVDVLRANGYSPLDVHFSAPALDPRYKNRRCEMWLEMAAWIGRGGALPPSVPELVAELTVPTYSFVAGKFVLEEKDQIKARLGRSPDLADSLALTFSMPDQPKGMAELQGSVGHYDTNWSPFDR